VPKLAGARFGNASARHDGLLRATWRMGDGSILHLEANLSDRANAQDVRPTAGITVWGDVGPGALAPWSVHWRIGTS
jgi:maltooligosyltrehalose trehalohydrolase